MTGNPPPPQLWQKNRPPLAPSKKIWVQVLQVYQTINISVILPIDYQKIKT